ncbi:DUF2752 domain-containing protein [Aquimarina algiphila]
MQRSIVLLLKGEFSAAFHMYPAIYPLMLLLAFIGFNFFIQFKNGKSIKVGLMIFTALTMIISYVIKMKVHFN